MYTIVEGPGKDHLDIDGTWAYKYNRMSLADQKTFKQYLTGTAIVNILDNLEE